MPITASHASAPVAPSEMTVYPEFSTESGWDIEADVHELTDEQRLYGVERGDPQFDSQAGGLLNAKLNRALARKLATPTKVTYGRNLSSSPMLSVSETMASVGAASPAVVSPCRSSNAFCGRYLRKQQGYGTGSRVETIGVSGSSDERAAQ